MIKNDTKQTIKFIIAVVVITIIVYIASVIIFLTAGKPSRENNQRIEQIATQKTEIKNIKKYYHLNRGIDSYSLVGVDQKGKTYYFIYLPKSKKAYIYPSNKAISATDIKKIFVKNHSKNEIRKINLGWYRGKAVWEISYINKDRLNYILYNFHTGKEINVVDNL